jgi:hypothetical protein
MTTGAMDGMADRTLVSSVRFRPHTFDIDELAFVKILRFRSNN